MRRRKASSVKSSKPLLSLSLDVDNLWSYLKTHGDSGWEAFPSYIDQFVEIALDRLARHDLRITFFVVGQDAALERNRAALRAIAEAGHEIANHSFHHEPWLHRWSRPRIEREVMEAEVAIEQATGRKPKGFRDSVERKPNPSSPVSRFDRMDALLLPSAPLRPKPPQRMGGRF